MNERAAEAAAPGARRAPPEMSREAAARRARSVKRALSWAAVLTFAVLWQAAAHHLTGVTSRTGAATSPQPGTSGGSGQTQSQNQGFNFGTGQNVQPFTQTTVS